MRKLTGALIGLLLASTVTAAPAAALPIGNANFIEWDIPANAGQPPAALEVAGQGPNRSVFYLTRALPPGPGVFPRLVRFTPGTPNIGIDPAAWRAWTYAENAGPTGTGGLKVSGSIVFIRDSLGISRVDTSAVTNNRVRWFDSQGSTSDLALDGATRAYTTAPVAGGTLQRLTVTSPTIASLTRWVVSGGAGSVYLSGVATGTGLGPGSNLVYYSEPTANQIGQLNPANNNVRRWALPLPASQPRQLDLDATGKVWVVTGSGHLVRLNPLTNDLTVYTIPTPASNPMGIGPNSFIGFTETGTNKVGMLIPDGTTQNATPSNTTAMPSTISNTGFSATLNQQSGTALPIAKTGPATTTGTAATGIFVEAQLPVSSTTPLAIEDDTVQTPGPPGAFTRAFFYSLGNPATNRIGRVELVRPAPEPTTLDLEQDSAVNPVDARHCVTATVRDQYGEPMQGINVEFRVTGSVTASGDTNTDNNGEAEFCYDGPAFPGADGIHAWADWNPDNDMQDLTAVPPEPFDDLVKTWVFPVSTPGCEVKVTNGGWIIAANGDRASFGGNAKVDEDDNVSGQEEYQDHGPAQPMNVHGDVLVVTCSTNQTQATIFGNATVDGADSGLYRIDVKDVQEPGAGYDTYRFRLEPPSTYDSGEQILMGGNIQIHKN